MCFRFLTLLAAIVAALTATAQVNRNINSYVLFAYDELVFKGGTMSSGSGFIVGGNIGVNYAGLSPTGYSLNFATSNRARMSDGYQAVADSVRGDADGSFYDLYANILNPSFASQIRGVGPIGYTGPIIATGLLPVLPFTPNRALTNSAADLTVTGLHTFLPGALRDVRINDNSVVTFGAGVFDIRSLDLGKNVTVNVLDSTIFQIDQDFSTNNGLKFGLGTKSGAKMFIGAYGFNVNTERVTNFSQNGEFHGQYFAPTGWLDLGGGSELYGRFWSQRITGDPNNNVYFVPEPGTVSVLVLSVAGLVAHRRRR